MRSLFPALALALAGAPLVADSFVNFETGPVRPLAIATERALLFAVNTPDNRVEVFALEEALPRSLGEVVVGLEPCALAYRAPGELWVVNHLSDSVSVVDVSDPERPFVKATLPVGDEPRDIVIAGPERDRVFVTTARRGQHRPGDPALTSAGEGRADIWVLDARDLTAPPRIVTLFCDTPRGLAVSPGGERVYAAAFHSGNRTTVLDELAVDPSPETNAQIGDGFVAPGMPPVPDELPVASETAPPRTSVILREEDGAWRDAAGRDWTPRVRFGLPDRDLFVIDATLEDPVEVAHAAGVGTILFNVAVHPIDGSVYVTNLESRNHVRFEPALTGDIARSRVTRVSFPAPGAAAAPLVEAVHLNPHVDHQQSAGDADDVARSLALPLDLVFSGDGQTLFACAYGSGKVAVLDAAAAVQRTIPVGGGPCGLALDEAHGRLYVLNRFELELAVVDLASFALAATVPLRYNPEPPAVRDGRPLLYDARRSGHGDAACASCHIFGDMDSLAWDLGDPTGEVEPNPVPRVGVQGNAALRAFHPMKGPMMTQSLRGLRGAGPMHWRGDRNGGTGAPLDEGAAFMTFRPAFETLLGLPQELPRQDMAAFRDFAMTIVYPPNPIAPLDGSLTPAQRRGKTIFDSDGSRTGLGGDGDACADCHTLPLGTDGRGSFENLIQDFKVAHLRNLYQKVGMFGSPIPFIATFPAVLEPTPTPHLGDQVRGFGFLHDGSVPTLFEFFRSPLSQFTFLDQGERTGKEKVRDLEAFLLAFPTGLAPVVGQQVTLDGPSSPGQRERLDLLLERAAAGDCDLVAHGVFDGVARGLLYVPELAVFQTDRMAETLAPAAALDALAAGDAAVLTLTAVPPGSGRRIGLDRDLDGALDRDELDRGRDPADPHDGASRFLLGDCNRDGRLDLSDAVFALERQFAGGGPVECAEACDTNSDGRGDLSDPIFALQFLFNSGAAPGRYPECEEPAGECAGGGECP